MVKSERLSYAEEAHTVEARMVELTESARLVTKRVRDGYLIEAVDFLYTAELNVQRSIEHAVIAARLRGHSWAEIGEALAMSKQAAWLKYHDLL